MCSARRVFRFARQLGVVVLTLVGTSAAAAPLRLTTHELPPYSFAGSGTRIGGVAVSVVECAAQVIDQPLEISILPWARAQAMVREGQADGFFAASQSAERDSFAVLSAIIAPQEWRWYFKAGSRLRPTTEAFRTEARVGSFLGGNMLSWLKENGYRVAASPVSNEQMLQMLMRNRVDAILANNLVMDSLLAANGLNSGIQSELLQDKPLGVYFSKTFLERSPGFLPRFNAAVEKCRKG